MIRSKCFCASGEGYGPYGNVVGSTGTTSPLGYTGAWTDPATGLVYLQARWYDPDTAQFMSVDPAVQSSGQPYNYVMDNPINGTDPLGLFCFSLNLHCIAGDVSTAASAVTALIPGLEPVSAVAAGTAVMADITGCVTGGCNWFALILDIAALVPGVAAAGLKAEGSPAVDRFGIEVIEEVDPAVEQDRAFKEFVAKAVGRTGAEFSAASATVGAFQSSAGVFGARRTQSTCG